MKSASIRQLGISGLRVTAKLACIAPLLFISERCTPSIRFAIALAMASPSGFHEYTAAYLRTAASRLAGGELWWIDMKASPPTAYIAFGLS